MSAQGSLSSPPAARRFLRLVPIAGVVFVTTLLGSVYTQILTFAAVILILVVLPHGLLGRAGVKKV